MFCAKSPSFVTQVQQMVRAPPFHLLCRTVYDGRLPVLHCVISIMSRDPGNVQVEDGVLMRWLPRVSVLTDDGVTHSLPDSGSSASDFIVCSICNATMSKSAMSVALMRPGCCFKIACATCFGTLWGIMPTAGIRAARVALVNTAAAACHPHVFCAESIVRTVETLAAQKRVLVCPICDRRLVQIEQMVAPQQHAAACIPLYTTPHCRLR